MSSNFHDITREEGGKKKRQQLIHTSRITQTLFLYTIQYLKNAHQQNHHETNPLSCISSPSLPHVCGGLRSLLREFLVSKESKQGAFKMLRITCSYICTIHRQIFHCIFKNHRQFFQNYS